MKSTSGEKEQCRLLKFRAARASFIAPDRSASGPACFATTDVQLHGLI